MNTLFWVYKMRLNAKGEASLMMRITHASKRVNINFNRYIDPKSWDNNRQKVKGAILLVKEINLLLLTHTTKMVKVYIDFLAPGKQFSVEQLRDFHFTALVLILVPNQSL